jgi:hypothetical protein
MPDLLERLTSALADRYAVKSEAGRGGMAMDREDWHGPRRPECVSFQSDPLDVIPARSGARCESSARRRSRYPRIPGESGIPQTRAPRTGTAVPS